MLLRSFERIAKTYRREKWDAMLLPLLETWYACAQQLGDVELSVQLLLEMLAHGQSIFPFCDQLSRCRREFCMETRADMCVQGLPWIKTSPMRCRRI